MTRLPCLGLAAALAVSLAACGKESAPEPQNETTGAAMPDTDSVANTGATTAPDAAATGTVTPNDGMGNNTTAGANPVTP